MKPHRTAHWLLPFFLLVLLSAFLHGAVPQLINYQGRVAVGGMNFDGAGEFKFALVSEGVNTSGQASGTSVLTVQFITSVVVADGGSGYSVAPAVSFSGGGGSGATAHAAISGGVVTSIVMDTSGTGYTSAPEVIIAAPPENFIYDTYWSNDGSSTNGSEPASSVNLSVTKGLYTVLLGDASLANMTTIPASVFVNDNVHLRVWFNDGTNGSQLFTPDQGIASVGYALVAGEVDTVPDGAITAEMIANGAVGSAHLPAGTVEDELDAAGQAGVPSGGVVLSASENPALVDAGYVRIGAMTPPLSWKDQPYGPAARSSHTAVWTGSEMIVWGGLDGAVDDLNDGGRYDPALDSWSAMSMTGAPSARHNHTAVWTGSEVIIWGGSNLFSMDTYFDDGGRYDPALDSWSAMNQIGAPSPRDNHTAVWTGIKMIIWGGGVNGPAYNDGSCYDPVNNDWTPVSSTMAPAVRLNHTAVWTGDEMIVWGGNHLGLDTGGRYDPVLDSWEATSMTGVPAARRYHTAVWTGSEMIVWGGGVSNNYLNDGGRYDPDLDSWSAMSGTGALAERVRHTAVWTGTEMIVWGGTHILNSQFATLNDGERYDPVLDSWSATSATGAPIERSNHTAVWTGDEMIVWGGHDGGARYDGERYDPVLDSWSMMSAASTPRGPRARSSHTAVWTGSELIVWGGSGGGIFLNTGGRYDPALDSWSATSTTGAPGARSDHTAIWTGSVMIVWGGRHLLNFQFPPLNDGGRYNPVLDSWSATSTTGAPAARSNHTAVWTGSRMIVWGGSGEQPIEFNDGSRYDPALDSWSATSPTGVPSVRYLHSAVWTGDEMIVWGGTDGTINPPSGGGRYDPALDSWDAVSTAGAAPTERIFHSALWTGNEMIVWGGSDGGRLSDGGRYDPALNSWAAMSTTEALPSARFSHTAVWTGSEMIVWGGSEGNNVYSVNGACYDPALDSWTTIRSTGAPTGRAGHTAVWTGSEMIVWGGGRMDFSLGDGGRYGPAKIFHLYQRP